VLPAESRTGRLRAGEKTRDRRCGGHRGDRSWSESVVLSAISFNKISLIAFLNIHALLMCVCVCVCHHVQLPSLEGFPVRDNFAKRKMNGFNNSVEDDVLADLAEIIPTRIYSRTEMKCQRCTDAKS